MKTILKMAAGLIACIAAGFALMVLVYLIPTENIEKHAAATALEFEAEGVNPYYYNMPGITGVRDKYTDALMIQTAAYTDPEDPVGAAMLNSHREISDTELTSVFSARYIYGREYDVLTDYGRYWHGYLVFLKPVLLITDYTGWQIVNSVFELALTGAALYLMYKRGLRRYMIPYIFSLVLIEPTVMMINIQNSICYTVMTAGVIAVILLKDRLDERAVYIFMFTGIATSFLDLLTYPLVTLGMPAVFCFCIWENGKVKDSLLRIVKISASWVLGYGGMWAGKWTAASLVTGRNTFADAIGQAIYRSGTLHHKDDPDDIFTIYDSISKNLYSCFGNLLGLAFGVFFLALLVLSVVKAAKSRPAVPGLLVRALPFAVLALYPFAWYSVIVNHSVIHAFLFPGKILVITALSLSCMLVKTIPGKDLPEATAQPE